VSDDIREGLAEILEEVAGVKPKDVQLDKSFTDDLDVDSLSMVEIALAAEDKFGVKIPDDELAGLKTVGDAVSYIEKARARLSRRSTGTAAGHRQPVTEPAAGVRHTSAPTMAPEFGRHRERDG